MAARLGGSFLRVLVYGIFDNFLGSLGCNWRRAYKGGEKGQVEYKFNYFGNFKLIH